MCYIRAILFLQESEKSSSFHSSSQKGKDSVNQKVARNFLRDAPKNWAKRASDVSLQSTLSSPSNLSFLHYISTKKMADNKLLSEIAGEHKLKHVEPVHDASAPAIDKDVKIKQVDRSGLLTDISSEHKLKHVEPVHDASAPAIDKDVKIKHVDRSGLLNEIASHKN